jgi:hypothetical protein
MPFAVKDETKIITAAAPRSAHSYAYEALRIVCNLLPKPEPEPGKHGGAESATAAASTTASTVSESPSKAAAAIMPTPIASTTTPNGS